MKRKSDSLHATPPTLFYVALPPSHPQSSFFFLNLILISLHFPPTNPIVFHCIPFRVFKNISDPSSPLGQCASSSSPYTSQCSIRHTSSHTPTYLHSCSYLSYPPRPIVRLSTCMYTYIDHEREEREEEK